MIKEIKITVTTTEDLPGILGIKKKVHENFVKQRPDIYKESDILYTNDFIESFFADASKRILVAKNHGHIIGYAFIQFVDIQLPMMTERTYIYINDLAVSEKYRNNGVASLLLKHIEVMAREMGAAKIELAVHVFSSNAIQLYRKNGYSPRAIRMEKEL
ncbi:MAG: GNAT family N-acetyltransferase [Desulfitobacterium hafniense]|jgi:ribosomal protein S18 acetylase RimI-like enzyme|nr:GNAT family N-acetyltransferase [Desulfitobacterium hafniense]